MWFAYQPTRDGRIVPCRVAESGEQIPIPGAAVMTDPLSATLTAHPSGKFLYASTRFDRDRDGYNNSSDKERPPDREKSFVRVYRVALDGRLTLMQTVPVKGILGKTLIYPDGKHFFAELPDNQYLAFAVRPDGTFSAPRRFPDFPTFNVVWSVGVEDDSHIAFVPGGKIGYYSNNWVMLEVSGAVLQRLRIASDGSLRFEGEEWRIGDGDPPSTAWKKNPGPVFYRPDGKAAVMQGRNGTLWHFPVGADGKLRSEKANKFPIAGTFFRSLLPFYRRDNAGAWTLFASLRGATGNTLYRLPAPGKAEKIAAFGAKDQFELRPTPDGRLLYEFFGEESQKGPYYKYQIAAYRVDDRGRVTPSAPRRPVEIIAPESIVFIEKRK